MLGRSRARCRFPRDGAGEAGYRVRVALTDEQAWTLTSAGLVALADGVLKGGEASRILALVDAQLAAEEQDLWIDRLADAGALWEYTRGLPRPPAERASQILRAAWSIALVDGEGSSEEVEVLARLGELFGVGREQLATWRRTWTAEAGELAQYVAAFAALLLHRRADAAREPMQPIDDQGRGEFQALLARLPLSEARRSRAMRLLDQAPTIDELGGALLLAEPARRGQALEEIARLIRGSNQVGPGRQLFLALTARMAVPEDVARVILD
nr:TerB family tellurite resistance protein [Nannocystis pusilla]